MNRPGPDHPTMQRHLLEERAWDVGWEGHELAQLRRRAALPLAQKIQWLEDAQRMANYFEAHRGEARLLIKPVESKDT